MLKLALTASIFLFPFQLFSPAIAESRYDLSCFILLGLAIYCFLNNFKFRKISFSALLVFSLVQIAVLFIFDLPPLSRFISGFVWFGGLLFVGIMAPAISNQKFYKIQTSVNTLLWTVSFSGLVILIQYFLFEEVRPKAFFGEPAYAGLIFYSASVALVAVAVKFKTTTKSKGLIILYSIFFAYLGFLTRSLHLVTFLVTLFLVFGLKYFGRRKIRIPSLKAIFSLLLLMPPVGLLIISSFQSEHFAARLSFEGINTTNLSLLSWLRGLDQAIASVIKSPFFGLGLGSTGYFDFNSPYSLPLSDLGMSELNLSDAFSLAFRLIIEVGLLIFCLILLYILYRITAFRRFFLRSSDMPSYTSMSTCFSFVFSLCVILGCLIKEPLYPHSSLYVAVFLFSSAKLH